MSSGGRSRNDDRLRRRRQPADRGSGRREQLDQSDHDRQQGSRRRTSYVPRQGSGRPRRFAPTDQDFERQDRRATPSRRAQQPQYRQPPQQQPYQDDYDQEQEDIVYDAPAPVRGRRGGSSQRRPTYRRDHELDDDERHGAPQAGELDYDDDYSDQYDDSFIDEDDWYEEEVAAGAARPRPARARGRTARSVARPSVTVPRVNLRRPTVPAGVREAAIAQDQNALFLAAGLLVSVLLMALFTSNRVDALAPGFATHISASGLAESVRTEAALWQLPLMAGAMFGMNAVLAWFVARWSRFLSRFFLITTVLVHLLIWVAFLRIAY